MSSTSVQYATNIRASMECVDAEIRLAQNARAMLIMSWFTYAIRSACHDWPLKCLGTQIARMIDNAVRTSV